jgi:hypothetical protein
MTASLLADWTNDDYCCLEQGVLLARHRLAETGLFTDENLIRIIDTHPAQHLSINTMGSDANHFQWREGDRNGVPGDVLLELVKTGRLWINCRRMLDHHPEISRAVHSIYDELEKKSPGFQAHDRSANLLISSPHALVHYHVDIPVNMLWHIRGQKRVWVYPHFDFRFASQHVLELVCAGEFSEDVPYDPDFDRYALVFDVEPGEMLTWPQLTPHRVVNHDSLNVSLSTEHKNPTAVRRINVHLANRFLRRKCGMSCRSTSVHGPVAHAKQTVARAVRYAHKLAGKRKKQYTYPVSFKVDPDAPLGFTLLDVPADHLAAPHEAGQFAYGR